MNTKTLELAKEWFESNDVEVIEEGNNLHIVSEYGDYTFQLADSEVEYRAELQKDLEESESENENTTRVFNIRVFYFNDDDLTTPYEEEDFEFIASNLESAFSIAKEKAMNSDKLVGHCNIKMEEI